MALHNMTYYFSKFQESEIKLRKIKANLRGIGFEFYSGSGVFSKDKIDKGTELLINSCILTHGWKVLDFGCGYGAIGISIAKFFPDTNVLMADINKRAVKLAKMNVKMNNIGNAHLTSSDLFQTINQRFNTIIVNPPQKAGKDVCFKIIEEAKNHLEPNGLLQLVARHNKGGKTLELKMKEVYGNVKEIAKKAGYRVYVSELT